MHAVNISQSFCTYGLNYREISHYVMRSQLLVSYAQERLEFVSLSFFYRKENRNLKTQRQGIANVAG